VELPTENIFGLIALLVLLVAIGLAIFKPWLGVVFYQGLALLHLESIWPNTFNSLRPSMMIGFALLAGGVIKVFQQRKNFQISFLRQVHPFLVLLLCLIVNLAHFTAEIEPGDAYLSSYDPNYMMRAFNMSIFFYFSSLVLINKWSQLYVLICLLAISTVFYAIWLNLQYLSLGFDHLESAPRMGGPAPGVYEDENVFAVFFIIGFSTVYYVALISNKAYVKYICWASLPVIGHAFYLTGSRGGLLSISCVIAFMALRSKSRLAGLAIVVVFIGTVFYLGGTAYERSSTTITTYADNQEAGLVDIRQAIWGVALEFIKENPWLGIGTGRFQTAQAEFAATGGRPFIECDGTPCNAHNTLLQFTISAGLLAGLLYLSIFIAASIQHRTERKKEFLVNNSPIRLKKANSRISFLRRFGHSAKSKLSRTPIPSTPEDKLRVHSGSIIYLAMLGFFIAAFFLNLMYLDVFYFLLLLLAVRTSLVKTELKNTQLRRADNLSRKRSTDQLRNSGTLKKRKRRSSSNRSGAGKAGIGRKRFISRPDEKRRLVEKRRRLTNSSDDDNREEDMTA